MKFMLVGLQLYISVPKKDTCLFEKNKKTNELTSLVSQSLNC